MINNIDYIKIFPDIPSPTNFKSGSFLDSEFTIQFKSAQMQKIAKLYRDDVIKSGDTLFFSDLWFPGIESIAYMNYFAKKDVKITSTTSPTNPPLPNPSIKAVRFAITSIPKTLVPVSTCQRIVTGKIAIIMPNNPPKNPETYFIIESMFILLKLSRFVAKLPLRFERLIIRI